MTVYYKDDHLVAVYKPYGVLSEYDDKKPNMPDLLKAAGYDRVYPVHRLDRTTCGVMIYALSAESASRLSALIQRGGMDKTYLAAVEGEPDEASGELCDLLYFDRRKNKSYVVKRERRGVKEARLRYETLKTARIGERTVSLVKIKLLTGRTHQIRVQFASRRMPLVGDRRYGSSVPADDIMLCSSRLSFTHPFTGEEMCFEHVPKNEYFGEF